MYISCLLSRFSHFVLPIRSRFTCSVSLNLFFVCLLFSAAAAKIVNRAKRKRKETTFVKLLINTINLILSSSLPLLVFNMHACSVWSRIEKAKTFSDLHTGITYVESSKWKTWNTLILKLLFLPFSSLFNTTCGSHSLPVILMFSTFLWKNNRRKNNKYWMIITEKAKSSNRPQSIVEGKG